MLIVEQLLNGIQFGMFLFLLSAGLTLIFGIMGFVNLAHGSFYMLGAYFAVLGYQLSNSFVGSLIIGVGLTLVIAFIFERFLAKHLYKRSHLDQVIVCIGMIFIFDELISLSFGKSPQFLPIPIEGSLELFDSFSYSYYRLFIIASGIFTAIVLYYLIDKTKIGMQIRAGENDRAMIKILGINVDRLFLFVFMLGSALSAIAGILSSPLLSIEIGMGNNIVILSFVCIIIGGLGSIYGAFIGSMIVGISDTLARIVLPYFFSLFFEDATSSMLAGALSSMVIFLVMIGILLYKPTGLFGQK
jgi:branched-chain amino acid transport system permease protein